MMSIPRSLSGLLVTLGLGVSLPGPLWAEDPLVTSDSPAYCDELVTRLSDMMRVTTPPPPSEVGSLTAEGESMCVHGQFRGGVMRLRRAIAIMRHNDE